MKTISVDLITHVIEMTEKNGTSTAAALDLLVGTGVYRAEEMPDAETMDATIRGFKKYKGGK